MIYIISHNRYKEFIKSGLYKYIPDFLLPKYWPRAIDNITKGEKIIGRVLGINLKPIDLSDGLCFDEYINSILNLKSDDDNLIYIEGIEDVDINIIKEIESRTSMTIPTGEKNWLYNLPILLKGLLQQLNENSFGDEVLIVCGDKEKTMQLIRTLPEDLRFISMIGNNEDVLEEIYETILDETGISLFQPSNIEHTIKDYNVIINLSDEAIWDFKSIRRKAIIFDLSNTKSLSKIVEEYKNNIIINSISISIKDTDILKNYWLGEQVSPRVYELLMADEFKKFYRIQWKSHNYSIEELINSEIKIKGNI